MGAGTDWQSCLTGSADLGLGLRWMPALPSLLVLVLALACPCGRRRCSRLGRRRPRGGCSRPGLASEEALLGSAASARG